MFRPLASHLLSNIALLASVLLLLAPLRTLAAFTVPVFSGNDTIDLNAADTWCYYPSVNSTSDIDSACAGSKADLQAVLQAHLSQPPLDSLSIAYYSGSLQRLGGADFPIGYAKGKVYLCVSGQREDGRYKTLCEVAVDDNQFGLVDESGRERENKTVCALEVGQRNVSDGCYVPVGMSAEDESAAIGIGGFTQGTALLLAILLPLGGWLSIP